MEADKKPTELATLLWVTILYKNVKVWGSPSRPQACEHDIAKLVPPSCDIVFKDLPASARGTDLLSLLDHLKTVVLTKAAAESALPSFQRCVAMLTSVWVRAKEALAMPHGSSAVAPECCRTRPASASPPPITIAEAPMAMDIERQASAAGAPPAPELGQAQPINYLQRARERVHELLAGVNAGTDQRAAAMLLCEVAEALGMTIDPTPCHHPSLSSDGGALSQSNPLVESGEGEDGDERH